jgi:hypothetical protein
MAPQQVKKLVALAIFVILLSIASLFLYKFLVKSSPYYPQEQESSQDE